MHENFKSNPNYAPIFAALADGPRDTMQIKDLTRIDYSALSGRLVRLRECGAIIPCGRRRVQYANSAGFAMVWKLPNGKPSPRDEPHRAGTIKIGRGFKWGAGLV